MPTDTYQTRRGELETYFDRTAVENWSRLTSNDAPVSRIRATVRAGRETMRTTLLDWLPADLSGHRVLDAGCGTGLLAVEAVRRGAEVIAVDISPNLIRIGQERLPDGFPEERLTFAVGDLADPDWGTFDYVVAMDSLIHYTLPDALEVVAGWAERTRHGMLFTFAPRTPLLTLKHAVGRLSPTLQHRAPAIQPIAEGKLRGRIQRSPALTAWHIGRSHRVDVGFYTSQAVELLPRG